MADHDMRLLLSSAGRRVELMECFRREATSLGIALDMLACDAEPRLSPACRLADAMFRVPPARDPAYVDSLLDICATHRVSMLVPTIDPELVPLARARNRFAAIGVDLVLGSAELVELARDKLATAEFLATHDIASPRTAALETVRSEQDSWDWPLMVKPRHGSASRGIRIAGSPAQLPDRPEEPLIAQKLLCGVEHTINMFYDASGALRAAVPHERLRVRAGEVEKGVTRRDGGLIELAERLARVLPGPRGSICFQTMAGPDGAPQVFEINARFGGGYPLAHGAGAKFTRWLLEEHLGLPTTAGNDGWRENLTMLRYDAAVFVLS